MEIKINILNIFPPLRELEKEGQLTVFFQNDLDEEYSLGELLKYKREVRLFGTTPEISIFLKQNRNRIASFAFVPNDDEVWLHILLEKKIKYGIVLIDSIKIKVKCLCKEKPEISNGLNIINTRAKSIFNSIELNPDQRKKQLNNLIKCLLQNPLFSYSSTEPTSIKERSMSVDKSYFQNNLNKQHSQSFKSYFQSKQVDNLILLKSSKTKKLEIRDNNHQKDYSFSTAYSDLNKRQSRTPKNRMELTRLFSKKSYSIKNGNNSTNNRITSSTRGSIADSTDTKSLRQKIEDNFNELLNKEKYLTQNDTNILDIEPSNSYIMEDIMMDDDDDIQLPFEENLSNFNLKYTKGYFRKIPQKSLKKETNVLIGKIRELSKLYHLNSSEYNGLFEKYKDLFINYSERYLQLNKMFVKMRFMNEESKITVQTLGLGDRYYNTLHKNLIKTNRNELNLLKTVIPYDKTKAKKRKDRLNEILTLVLNKAKKGEKVSSQKHKVLELKVSKNLDYTVNYKKSRHNSLDVTKNIFKPNSSRAITERIRSNNRRLNNHSGRKCHNEV